MKKELIKQPDLKAYKTRKLQIGGIVAGKPSTPRTTRNILSATAASAASQNPPYLKPPVGAILGQGAGTIHTAKQMFKPKKNSALNYMKKNKAIQQGMNTTTSFTPTSVMQGGGMVTEKPYTSTFAPSANKAAIEKSRINKMNASKKVWSPEYVYNRQKAGKSDARKSSDEYKKEQISNRQGAVKRALQVRADVARRKASGKPQLLDTMPALVGYKK